MDRRGSGSESRFAAYVEGLVSVIGRRPGAAAARLLPGPDAALRTQERGADGGGDGTGTDGCAAPIAVAFCRRGALVGRDGSRQSSGDGAACDRTARADRGMDHRRYWLSQEGHAFGW